MQLQTQLPLLTVTLISRTLEGHLMISRVHHHVQQAEPQGAFCSNSILVRASFGFIMTALIKDPVCLLMLAFTLSVLVFLAVLPVLRGVLHWHHGFLCPRVRHSVWQTQGALGPWTNSWLMFMGFRSKLGVAGGRGKRWTGQRASRTWEALTGLVEGVLCTDMGSSHWCSWSPVRSLLWEKLAWALPHHPVIPRCSKLLSGTACSKCDCH